jgi:hypothetical protein
MFIDLLCGNLQWNKHCCMRFVFLKAVKISHKRYAISWLVERLLASQESVRCVFLCTFCFCVTGTLCFQSPCSLWYDERISIRTWVWLSVDSVKWVNLNCGQPCFIFHFRDSDRLRVHFAVCQHNVINGEPGHSLGQHSPAEYGR